MTKTEEIYNQIKDNLTSREQDFVNMIFKIKDTDTKTYEEFQKKYDLSYEQIRSVARDLLSKYQKEITQLQYETHTH